MSSEPSKEALKEARRICESSWHNAPVANGYCLDEHCPWCEDCAKSLDAFRKAALEEAAKLVDDADEQLPKWKLAAEIRALIGGGNG